MILDSSAVVAVMLREPDSERLFEQIAGASLPGIGAPTLVETSIVLSSRLDRDARGLLARFLDEAAVAIVPFGDAHWSAAVEAWLLFGRGRHEANLNFGDCLAYATARVANQPLLCVGDDFAKTDLPLA